MAAKISVNVLADISQALKSIKDFQKQTADSMKKVEDSANFVTNSIKLIGVAFAGIQVGKFVSSIVKAASEQEDAINQLNVALAASGKFSKEASDDLQAFATELQRTTKFGDETVISASALIETITQLDKESLKGATLAAANLASALNIDLQTAATLVGKAVEGNVGALKRYGISVKAGATESENLANVLRALNGQFGGAAAAQLNTFSGALAKAKNAYSDIFEEAGSVITQNTAVISTLKLAGSIFERVTEIVKANKEAISALIADAIKVLISLIPTLVSSFEILNQAFLKVVEGTNLVRKGINQVVGLFAAIGKGAAGTEIAKAVQEDNAAIDESTKKARQNAAVRTKVLSQVVGATKSLTDETLKGIKAGQTSAQVFVNNANAAAIAAEKAAEQLEKLNELKSKFFSESAKNPFAALAGQVKLPEGLDRAQVGGGEQATVVATGFLNQIAKGSKGAIESVTQLISTGLTAALGPIGAIFGEVIGLLAQGPEKVRETVTAFIDALPVILENIILSIPALVTALVEKIPEVIFALIDKLPLLIDGFIAQLPRLFSAIIAQLPFLTTRIAIAFIQQIPSLIQVFAKEMLKIPAQFGKALVDEIKKLLGGIGGSGLGGSGILGSEGLLGIKGIPLLAKGGEVPSGFPLDSFFAGLSSGENVVDRSTNSRLNRFLDSFEREPQREAEQVSAQNQDLTVNLRMGEQELANVMLNLNRQGFRTA